MWCWVHVGNVIGWTGSKKLVHEQDWLQSCFVILYATVSDHGERDMLMSSIAGGHKGSKQISK